MENINYKKRIADSQVEEYLKLFGAVCIEGPKYCGKTWLGRKHAKSETLLQKKEGEKSNEVELAKISPKLVLEGEKPRLIDEWQEATNLWDEIRIDVDRSGLKGQYILTGSSTPKRDNISHSGAGRYGKIYLRTMSLYESGDSSGLVSLKDICDGKKIEVSTGEVDLRHLASLIIRGGWPANLNLTSSESKKVVNEYLNLIINDDLYRLDGANRDKHKMRLLLKSLARNESTTASNSTIKNDINEVDNEDIDMNTLSSYLNALDKLFLLDNDEPFSTNIRSSVRVKQAEKRHFADPSIAAALLNLSEEKLINDLETFGLLFEALVERDLKVYAESMGAKTYHYQDYLNREIDQIIELEDGDWCAFEIKLGANQIDSAASNLLKIRDGIKENNGKTPKVLCIICGMTSAAYQRPDGVYVVPITALKN
ncbi:MAG: DUF4143 domain-containing protein [Bacilli bacterium]|nr:DUF4143 domain-containing protein [Clostridium sp.]MDY2804807.1 DUF4143 domain-containing protein [Bacilli bacterium]